MHFTRALLAGLFTGLAAWAGLTVPVQAIGSQDVRYVHVVSTLTGLGGSKSELLILKKDGVFHADHYRYSPAQIDELLQAAQAPPVPELDLDRLDLTQQWLDSNAARVLAEMKASPDFKNAAGTNGNWTVKDDRRFLDAFKNLERVRGLLQAYYRERWENDYPELTIVFSLENGEALRVRSASQHLFMIPWTVERDGGQQITYNPRIGVALAKLLPWKFGTNRERLSGDLGRLIGGRLVFPSSPVFSGSRNRFSGD